MRKSETVSAGPARTAVALCLCGTTLGILGLAGRLLEIGSLSTFIAGRPPMMPNTACALVAAGLAAALIPPRASGRRSSLLVGKSLALFVLLLGIGTTAEYAFGWNLSIDQLFISVDAGAPYPGRPSPPTAVSFILVGAALLTWGRDRAAVLRLNLWLTTAAAFLAFVSIAGHLYGAGELYQLRGTPVIGVALPTAASLLLITTGMLLRDPAGHVAMLLASKRPGGILVRRFGTVAILGMPLLGVVAYRTLRMAGVEDIPLTLAILTMVGVPLALFLVVVTAKRLDRTHAELEASHERARLLVEESADAIFVADLDGRYTDVNAAGCRLLRMPKEAIVGKTILDLIPPEEARALAASREQLVRGHTHTSEFHLRRSDGTYVPVEVSAKILEDGRWQGLVRDISRRKAAEEAARRSEARLQGIISIAADAIISIDDDQRILMYNEGAQRIFGWSPAEAIGQPLDILLPPRYVGQHRAHVQQFGRERGAARMMAGRSTVTGLRRNGEEFPAEAAISKLDLDGQRTFTIFLRDTTTTRRLEEDLRRNLQRLRVLADAGEVLNASVAAGDLGVRIADVAVHHIAQCCAVELSEPWSQITIRCADGTQHDGVAPFLVERLRLHEPLLAGEVPDEWLTVLGSDHALARLAAETQSSVIAVPIVVGERALGAMLFLSGRARRYGAADLELTVDLARRAGLALENQRLYREAQMATRARDEVLSIVAHDIRSPLAAVQLGADLLALQVPEDRRESTRGVVDAIRQSMRRVARLLDDLLDVARIEQGRLEILPKIVSPEGIVRAALEAFASIAASASIHLECAVAPGLAPVAVDEDRIHQALANLLDNAVKFTPSGGRVSIVVAPEAGAVRFAVMDSGSGIPAEQLERVFDRFWQARSSRRGAGLGLTIVKGIVEAHGGRISVQSVPGRGSTFAFTIPSSDGGGAATHDAREGTLTSTRSAST